MKKNRSLRSMIFFLAVVLIIPILCFTLYLQVQTWRTMKHNLQRELEGELNTANHTLEMVIDKYDMVLYDFCTDDEIIELVEQINESEKPSDAVKYQIRRSLAHICNRNAGVEGITLITESGTVCFYDKEAASFVSTKWANKIPKVDMQDQMAVYQGSVLCAWNRKPAGPYASADQASGRLQKHQPPDWYSGSQRESVCAVG